jgi:choline dehydrogenase-like flavoprotein
MESEFDVVIVGSGAGGAPIAYELAGRGRSVLVLEKGPLLREQLGGSGANDGFKGANSDFKRDELYATGAQKILTVPGVANIGEAFYGSHVEPDLNDEPHVYEGEGHRDYATVEGYTAQVVGGGTQLYGGVSLRFQPDDFRLGTLCSDKSFEADHTEEIRAGAVDWPLTYEDLEPYYLKAERLVGINGDASGQSKPFPQVAYQKPLDPNPISQYALRGMQRLGLVAYRTPQAVITEDHAESGRRAGDPKTGFVNRYGDPLGFKSNTWVSLLQPAIRRNPDALTLRANCVVTHLSSEGARVTKVHYRDAQGNACEVGGKLVVVACSAIETVRLLLLSAVLAPQEFGARIHQNKHPTQSLLGKYFLTHCFGGASVTLPKAYRCDKSLSVDSDWATDSLASPAFLHENGLWAGGVLYNNTSDEALPISLARTHLATDLDTFWKGFMEDIDIRGDGMVDWLDEQFGTRLSMTFMANQLPVFSNRIELHPSVRDKWGRPVAYVRKTWGKHDLYLMDIYAQWCKKVLMLGVEGLKFDPSAEPWAGVVGFGSVYQAENALSRCANHIMGGARMGVSGAMSVVDRHCRAWEFDNLFITDGACMPTSGGANPTLTIQANAFRVADFLASI